MHKFAITVAIGTMLYSLSAPQAPQAVQAQGTGANQGDPGRTTQRTQTQGVPYRRTNTTQKQMAARPLTRTVPLGGIFSAATRNGLPATNMDSFVTQAGGDAEMIYGDEGVVDIPPYFDFTKDHRINTGIHGERYQGLSTGHSSDLPDAWGGDEFVKGPEWDMSGNGSDAIPRVQYGAPVNGVSF